MATVNPDDLFAVNRDDITYSVEQQNLMASLEGTDYLAVNRDDVTYKITGQEFIESIIDPLALSPRVTPEAPLTGELLTVDPNVFGGKSPFVYSYQWKYKTTEDGAVVDYVGETGTTYLTSGADEGYYIACEVTVTDSLGTTVTELSNFTEPVTVPSIVVKPSIIAPSDGAGELVSATSDEITGVSAQDSTVEMYVMSSAPTDLADILANGVFVDPANNTQPLSNYLVIVLNGYSGVGTPVWSANGTGSIGQGGTDTGTFAADGTRLSGASVGYSSSDWTSFTYTDDTSDIPPFYLVQTHGAYVVFNRNSTGTIPEQSPTSSTTLTLAGDKDLTVFQSLDDVQQDSGHTPTSSEIVDVFPGPTDVYTITATSLTGTIRGYSGPPLLDNVSEVDSAINGVPAALDWINNDFKTKPCYNSNLNDEFKLGNQGIQIGKGSEDASITFSYTNGAGKSFRVVYGASSGSGNGVVGTYGIISGDATGTFQEVAVSKNVLPKFLTTVSFTQDSGTFTIRNRIADVPAFWHFIELSPETVLTLTDDTDLANFREGDVVTGASAGVSITESNVVTMYDDTATAVSNPSPDLISSKLSNYSYFNADLNDANKQGNKGLYMYGSASITFTYSGHTPGDTIDIVAGSASTNNNAGNQRFTVSGDVQEDSTDVIFVPSTESSKTVLPKQLTQLTTTASSGTVTLTVGLADSNVGSQIFLHYIQGLAGAVSITNINSSTPSITVNGGTWTNGDVVTGPATTPATGTVASTDPAANTMTLSVSDETSPKRWIVNQGKFVKGEEKPSPDEPVDISGMIDITPNTDEITGIGDTVAATSDTYYSTTLYTTKADVVANATPLVSGQTVSKGNIIYVLPNGSTNIGDKPFVTNAPFVTTVFSIYSYYNGAWSTGWGNLNSTDVNECGWVDETSVADYGGSDPYPLPINADMVVFSEAQGVDSPDVVNGITDDFPGIEYQGDPAKSLTLAGAKDLELFEADDAVAQDSGHTPTSSLITGVNAPEVTGFIYSNGTDNTETTGFPDVMVANRVSELFREKGRITTLEDYLGITNFTSSSQNIRIFTAPAPNSPEGDWNNTYGTNLNGENADWGQELENRKAGDYVLVMSYEDTNNTKFSVSGNMAVQGPTQLTLTDDTDLANFRVGDLITQSPVTFTQSFVTVGTGSARAVNLQQVFDGDTNTYGSFFFTPTGGSFTNTDQYVIIGDLDQTGVSDLQVEIFPNVNTECAYWINGDSSNAIKFTNSGGRSTIDLTSLVTAAGGVFTSLHSGTASPDYPETEIAIYQILVNGNPLVSQFGTVSGIGTNTLTLSDVSGVWTAGNYAKGPATTPATGVFASTDGINTMTLSASDETYPKRWIVNQGKYVVGPEKTTEGFLHLYSSEFASEPADVLAHTTSDWQITLKTDTTYSSPVDETSFNSTDLTSWPPTNLEGGESYRCRVRHRSQEIQSEWSDDVTFMTADEEEETVETALPGNLQGYGAVGIINYTASDGTLMKNFSNSRNTVFGIGVNGKIYEALANVTADQTMTLVTGMHADFDGNNSAFVTPYNFTAGSTGVCIRVTDDNTAMFYRNGGSSLISSAPTPTIVSVFLIGAGSDIIGAVTESGNILVTSTSSQQIAGLTTSGETTNDLGFVIPTGKKPVKCVACGRGLGGFKIMVIDEDGYLWAAGENGGDAANGIPGIPDTGTLANPVAVQPGTTFKRLTSMRNYTVRAERTLCAMASNGEIWYGKTSKDYIGTPDGPITFSNTGQIQDFAWWANSATSPYLSIENGVLVAAEQNSNYAFQPITPTVTMSRPGSGPYLCQASTSLTYFINPA